jgi:hypothetical protein
MKEYEKIAIELTPDILLEFKLGSDCGTKETKPILITPDNKEIYYGAFIVEYGEIIELNPDNISVYVNRRVNMRTIDGCMNLYYCHHCTGALIYAKQHETSERYQKYLIDSMLKSVGIRPR